MPSLLDASTIAVAEPASAQPRGDLEPVDVRQLDVEENDIRFEPERRGDPGLAVAGGSDDGESVGLEHAPCDGPERRVVVDDQHRRLCFEQPGGADRLIDHHLTLIRPSHLAAPETARRGQGAGRDAACTSSGRSSSTLIPR